MMSGDREPGHVENIHEAVSIYISIYIREG